MTRRQATTSIHDSDRATRRRAARRGRRMSVRRQRQVAAVAKAAVAMAAVAAGLVAYNVTRPDGGPGSQLAQTPPAGAHAVDVLIDGWSLRTLEGREVTVTWAGGTARPVQFEPVTRADIGQLLRTTPEAVQTALARQLDPSTDLTCSSKGCSAGGAAVDAGDLLLESGSDATRLLVGNGVESGLLKARIEVPAGTPTVRVAATGYDGVTLSVGPVTEDSGPDGPGAASDPALSNGFQQGRWLLGAGLGRVFVADAAWLGQTEPRLARPAASAGALPSDALARVTAAPVGVASTGLSRPLPAAAQWTSSQLTLATSPSVGCAAGVLCFPGELPVTEVGGPVRVAEVNSEGERAVVALDDRLVTVDLPAPIRQAGVDGLVSGQVELRFVTAALHQGATASPVDWAGLVDLEDRAPYELSDVLGHVRLAGRTWTAAD